MESLIKVRIIDPYNRIISVRCSPSDKISDLYKKYIENGGDKNNNQFKFGREEIKDWDQTLSYYNIEDDDVIISFNEIKEILIDVIIEDYRGGKISVRCSPNDKISDLYKRYVENGGNKNCDQFKFEGMILKMSAKLSYYYIEDGDIINVTERARGGGIDMAPVKIDRIKDEPDYLITSDGLNLF